MPLDNTVEIIKNILGLMGLRFDSVEKVEDSKSNYFKYLIKTEESGVLIGPNGANLDALNYLVRKIASKQNDDETSAQFSIDVNGYHDKALESLKTKAKIMSDRAKSFKIDVELDPMSSYERMIVHSHLEGIPEIKTESIGEGSSRRVVIKYIGAVSNPEKFI